MFWNNFYFKNLLAAAIVVVALFAGVLYWLDAFTHHNEALLVPDVKGMSPEEAATLLQQKSLRYEISDSVYAKGKAPGSIIEQIPAANAKVKTNRIVFLVINARSVQLVPLPDVTDNSQRQAEASLEASGFKIGTIEVVQSEWKGLVLEVSHNGRTIGAGTKLPQGSVISLQVGGEVDVDSLQLDTNNRPVEVPKNDESWF